MNTRKYDVAIIGGGVIGSSIAFQLSKRGRSVVVLEKKQIASQSSGAAAGMLGAQSEFSSDSPVIPFALKSREMFPKIAEELKDLTGIDIGLIQKGLIKVAFTEEEEQALEEQFQFWKVRDSSVRSLNHQELHDLEPNVTIEAKKAMYIPHDGQVRADDLTHAFAKAASVYGAEIQEHTEVLSFSKDNNRIMGVITNKGAIYADQVVVCGGAWSFLLLKQTNLNLSMYPVKGECFSVITERPLLEATIFSKSGCYIVPKKGNRLLIGATSIPNTFDQRVSVDGISSLLERAKMILPQLKDTKWEKVWSGIRPQTDDGIPYLGEHPQYKGLWVATGHYRNGILLSPITGVLLANLLEGKRTEGLDLSSFSLIRNNTLSITT